MSRPQTPPHHPIHSVHLTTLEIEKLVAGYSPGLELITASDLPSNRSWNNRIYFLGVRDKNDPMAKQQELVLKVNGRFFGPEKVENEVACMRLLQTYCPNVPAPRALAWATGGASMTAVSTEMLLESRLEISYSCWILMTRMPGEPISIVEPGAQTMNELAGQLADYATSWRRCIPAQKQCGNLRFCANEYEDAEPAFGQSGKLHGSPLNLVIRGVLGDNIKVPDAMTTLAQYYRVKLEDKIRRLETSDTFRHSKHLATRIQRFLELGMDRLGLTQTSAGSDAENSGFVFTHYDLSPRNVLISGAPPIITGIVDFEFAGFFAPVEEFLNDHVNNDGDWTKPVYDMYLKQLEHNSVATPRHGISQEHWQQTLWLEQLIQNIAPWWLPGKYEGEGLEFELSKARKTVQDMLNNLEEAAGLEFEKNHPLRG